MSLPKRALLSVVGLLLGCSSSGEYTCPDPIGRIIRDDCEAYRTRYEALKVELGASLGPLGAKVALGEQSIRDPSEMLQLLAHRTHALCRDFNACRVPPLEYRQRREQTDCIFTAASAIQAQLKPELDKESQLKLVQELARVLKGETCGGPVASVAPAAGSETQPPRKPAERRMAYRSSSPWFGTQLLPPQPPAAEGFPQLVRTDVDLQAVFRQQAPHGVVGYRPRVQLELWGTASPDDMVTVEIGPQRAECPVGRGRNGLVAARCKMPEALVLTASSFTVKVSYRRGADGKTAALGQRQVAVISRRIEDTKNDSHRYGVNHDAEVREGHLVFRPAEGALPPDFERPSLRVVLRLRKFDGLEETARCWVDGKLITRAITASRYSGQVGAFQDRPRWQRTGPGSSRGVADPHINWRSYDFPLPFVVPRSGGAKLPAKDDRRWPLPGRWRCVVSVDGEPVRELTFEVKGDGRLAPDPRQTERARAAWLVRTRVLKNPVEAVIE